MESVEKRGRWRPLLVLAKWIITGALLGSCGGGGERDTGSNVDVTMQLSVTPLSSTEVSLDWSSHPGVSHYIIYVNGSVAVNGYWSSSSPGFRMDGLSPDSKYGRRPSARI